MCICSGCGKLIENKYCYCPWCGYSRVQQEKPDSIELRYAQYKEKIQQNRQLQIEKMEEQLEHLEEELSVLVLSAQMAR